MKRRSLIIGIDRYDSENVKGLSGCVNDAQAMWSVLSEHYKFTARPGEHWFLSASDPPADNERTPDRKGILLAFDELIDATESGDMVVIYYAGHGSRVADRDLDEGDGSDSTIMPTDAQRWSSPEEFPDDSILDITDDEIHVKLLRLSAKTDNITMIFDSCHAGTISRGEGTGRGAPRDPRTADQIAPVQFSPEEQRVLRETRHNSSGLLSAEGKYVLIAGCRDTEQSQEISVGETTRGALTHFLCEALVQAKPTSASGGKTTYANVFAQVAGKVTTEARSQNNALQHPQIEGAQDRLLFNTAEIEPLAFVRIENAPALTVLDGQSSLMVNLAGGAPFGLTKGSRWAVVAQGSQDTDNRLGELEIVKVGAIRSLARVVSAVSSGAIEPNSWAVPISRSFGDLRRKVVMEAIIDGGDAWDSLKSAIEEEGSLELLGESGRGKAVRAILVGEGDPPESLGLPEVGAFAEPTILVLSEGGTLMMVPKPLSAWKGVLRNLRRWAQYRHRLAIDNPLSELSTALQVDVRRKGPSGEWEPVTASEGLPVIQVGERVHIRVANKSDEVVHVNMLTFKMNGAIEFNGHFDLKPDVELPFLALTGDDGAEPLEWDDDFPFVPTPFSEAPVEGTEIWKFFVTKEPISFEFLQQQGATRARADGTPLGPIEELLATAGSSRARQVVPDDSWGTAEYRFTLRAKADHEAEEDKEVEIHMATVRPSGAPVRVSAGGKVRVAGVERTPDWSDDTPAGRLRELFAEQRIRKVQSFTLGDPATSRSRGAAAVQLSPDGLREPGWGELAMSTDDEGLVRWHFPRGAAEATSDAGGAGGGRGASATYDIPRPPVDEAASRSRGFAGAILGKVIVDRLAFPLLDPLVGFGLNKWETARRPNQIRWLSEADIRADGVRPVEGEGWPKLAAGPSLLLLHGTFSRAHKSFGDLPEGFYAGMREKYGDRIFAFDHTTLSEDPLANAKWFLEQLPPGTHLDLDIVGHSRGGLVARALAERGSEFSSEGRRADVGRMILVGSPNGGTPLADEANVDTMMSVYTNLLSFVDPTEVAGTILQLVQKLASGALKDLAGIQAMAPGSEFLSSLPGPRANGGVEYYGLVSDVASRDDKLLRRIFDRMVSGVLGGGPNDLLITEASAWGAADGELPFAETKTLSGAHATSHVGYFKSKAVQEQIGTWLRRDAPPIHVRTQIEVQPEAKSPQFEPEVTPDQEPVFDAAPTSESDTDSSRPLGGRHRPPLPPARRPTPTWADEARERPRRPPRPPQ